MLRVSLLIDIGMLLGEAVDRGWRVGQKARRVRPLEVEELVSKPGLGLSDRIRSQWVVGESRVLVVARVRTVGHARGR
jgi:hypothetical protein